MSSLQKLQWFNSRLQNNVMGVKRKLLRQKTQDCALKADVQFFHDTSNLGVGLYIKTILQIGTEWDVPGIEKEPQKLILP